MTFHPNDAQKAHLRNVCNAWHKARHKALEQYQMRSTPELIRRFFALHDQLTQEWDIPARLDLEGLMEHDRLRVVLRSRGISEIDESYHLPRIRQRLLDEAA